MLICFGCSWPTAIAKTLRTRCVDGVSLPFLVLIVTGYGSGMLYKLTGRFDWVFALYLLNFLMVGFEIALYFRFRAPQAPATQND